MLTADARASCARPFGQFPPHPAMLGTANGAGWCRNPCIPALRRCGRSRAYMVGARAKRYRLLLLRQDAAQTGPLWRGERAEEKPAGWRAGCAPVRCMHMDVHSANPVARSRSRRAGCPETAPPGVCFFGYFLCTSKESDPLARRASGSLALRKIKMNSRLRGNDVKRKKLDSGFRRNDELRRKAKPEPDVIPRQLATASRGRSGTARRCR